MTDEFPTFQYDPQNTQNARLWSFFSLQEASGFLFSGIISSYWWISFKTTQPKTSQVSVKLWEKNLIRTLHVTGGASGEWPWDVTRQMVPAHRHPWLPSLPYLLMFMNHVTKSSLLEVVYCTLYWVHCGVCAHDFQIIRKLETGVEEKWFLVTLDDLQELKKVKEAQCGKMGGARIEEIKKA